MKTWMKALGLFLIFVPMSVRAGVIFSDDFQQFTNGTVLTQTNYTPNIGVSAEVDTNDSSGENSTTVVASNFLGSIRTFFALTNVPYRAEYRGNPTTGGQTNQELTLSFKLWIAALKTTNHFGGFQASVLTTNIDSIDQNGTNYDSEPLIFINDGGQVVTFTNTPSPQTSLPIGSWSNLVNKVMTNVLVVNYPGGTFSFSINGSVLTNMPIPGYVSNLYDNVRLEVTEDITNSGVASLGNRFALDDVLLTNNVVLTNVDVESFLVVKGQLWTQSLGSVTMETTGWVFHAEVKGFVSNSIVSDTVSTGQTPLTLTRSDPSSRTLTFDDAFTNQPLLDAAYPNGSYTQNINTLNSGGYIAAVAVTNDTYPTTPQISNLAAAQTIDSATNFTLTWNTFTAGGTQDFISVDITDTNGNDAFVTPDFDQTNAMNGTATSVVIPGGTLSSSNTYDGVLLFAKRVSINTNGIPGALGIGTYSKETEFSITTLGTTVCVFAISPTNTAFSSAGGSSNITVTAQNGCAWTATNNDSFISITSGSSGSGNGTVNYSVAANTNFTGLTGTITVAGQTFTVIEAAAPCGVALGSSSANFGSAGGSSNVNVTADTTNCTWTAVSNNSFIMITGGTNGVGNGTVSYTVAANTNTLGLTGTITIGDQTFTVTQGAAPCTVAPATTSATFAAAAGSSNVVVTANGTNCTWTAVSSNAFVTITAGSNGTGNGTVSYSVAANTNTLSRTGTMTIAGQTFTVTQTAAACTFTLSATNAAFAIAGGSSNVTVTANGTNCAWTAASNNAFITITAGTNTTGSGAVTYSVTANTNTFGRSGTMTIAGQTFTVTQAAVPCTFTLSATNAAFATAGGPSNVTVTANGTNCAWTAVSNNGFITITAGTNHVGNGTVTYTVAVNSNAVNLTGTMTIAGQTFTVTQSAAACSVAPASTNATFTAAGGSSNVVVTANGTNCTWTAASNNAFITITAGTTNGTGNGAVSYTVAANTNTLGRTGTMTVAGQTFTVTQVAAACTFTLGATNAAFANAGGSSNVTVTANGTNCSWTAVSNSGFITITAGANGTGNGTVDYTVAVNTNGSPRTGTMTIGAQTFTVTQAARSDLEITKSAAPDPIEVKSNLTYTITVTNAGPDTAVSVTVTDSLPGGVTFVSAKPRTAKRSGLNVIDNLGSLSAGTSTTMTIIVRTPATAAVLTNIATVSSSTQDPNTNNNVASAITTVIVPPIDDLAVFKTNDVPSIVLVGTNFTYTLAVTNLGPNTATGVTLVDRLETNHIRFVSVNNGNCVNSNGVVVCDFGTLNSGAGVTISIVVTGVAPGRVCNTATITGSIVDKVKTNNSSEACTLIDVHDLATTRLVAPKKIILTSTHTNLLGNVSVTIQNRSTHTESITDTNMFTNLVTLVVSPVGSNDCTTPVPVPKIPKKFPITLKSKQTLTMTYSLNFGCPSAPSGWTNVYQYVATVHHEALAGGIPDMQPPCDVCPRGPLATPGNRDPNPDGKIIDKGCGAKGTNGVLGASVLTTVIKN